MARVLPPINVASVKYPLDAVRGPRCLLRSDAGNLLGLDSYGAGPMALTQHHSSEREPSDPFMRVHSNGRGVQGRLPGAR
jgi:hypothetical protein